MNRFFILYKKEFKQLFLSLISFFSLLFFPLSITVWTFYVLHFFDGVKADLSGFFGLFPSLFILIIPLLAMKSWVDEKKYKTSELLFTMPFSENEIVLARYLSVISVITFMFILSMVVPITLIPLGSFDNGKIISSYAGLFLYAYASASICLLITCFVSGSLISWLLSAAVLLILSGGAIGGNSFFSFISFSSHMESFIRGLLSIGDIAYFIILIILPLFLSGRILYLRRWNK